MPEDRAQAFLQLIRKSQRGRLKVYLGYGPGVGKTFQMLSEAHRLKKDGHRRRRRPGGNPRPRRDRQARRRLGSGSPAKVEYHGIVVEEMDTDADPRNAGRRSCSIDELAHTNVPGSRNAKRYQDVQDILAAGIHVISALNVQHLESLYNTVEQLIGVKVRERIPDSVLSEADQVVNIDLAAEDLQSRLRDGKIYPKERVASSLENFFTESNLEHLRELTLRELASQLDFKRRETTALDHHTVAANSAPDQIMVCLSSRGPNSARLLRFASRLAGRINRNWYAVYVQTPKEEPTVIDAVTQRLLADTLTLANQLGATVFTFKGQDVADTILRFANEYRVGQVVIGRPRPVPWWKRIVGGHSVAEGLIQRARGVSIVVVDAESDERTATEFVEPNAPSTDGVTRPSGALGGLLVPERIIIWKDPVTKQDIRQRLAEVVVAGKPGLTPKHVIEKLLEREQQGSTYLNEGVALPHARLEEITEPLVALGLTHGGVLDSQTEKPVEAVFVLLSPESGSNIHLQLLARVGRALQNRALRRALLEAQTPRDALQAISDYESAAAAARAAPKT
jgi:two-component system sensor histidine kinase KdpD